MRYLLDTHLLLWAAGHPERLSPSARATLEDPGNELLFSAVNMWEIVIKSGLGRTDFRVDAMVLRRGLLNNGYAELSLSSEHVLAIAGLPGLHKDPFDRMLLAQSRSEGVTLLTADPLVAQYPGPVRAV